MKYHGAAISLTCHYENPSWRSSVASPARPLQKPARSVAKRVNSYTTRACPSHTRRLHTPQPQSRLMPEPHLMPDSRVPLVPAAGPVFPGLPMPTLRVSLPLSQSVVSAHGPAPAPVKSPAVESALRSSPLPGSCTSTPTYDLLPIDIDVMMSASWPGLNQSICQYHRTHTFHRSCCHRNGFARMLM